VSNYFVQACEVEFK